MRTASWLPLAALLACAPTATPAPAPASAAASPGPVPSPSPPPPLPSESVADASAARSAPDAAATAAPAAPAAPVTRSGKEWPFHAWNRAEAVTFNQFEMRPRVQLRAYEDRGWSEHLGARKPLAMPDAKRAVDWIKQTEGAVDVSKCPFPRHAVVLYEGDVPVASINVCFECGDIMLWPAWQPEPDWDKLTAKQRKDLTAQNDRKLKRYEKVFPEWKKFFRDDVGFSIDR